jgi:hypothetical protein
MKKLILNAVVALLFIFIVSSCAVDRCPANNGGYMELKMPKQNSTTDHLVMQKQNPDKNANN